MNDDADMSSAYPKQDEEEQLDFPVCDVLIQPRKRAHSQEFIEIPIEYSDDSTEVPAIDSDVKQ